MDLPSKVHRLIYHKEAKITGNPSCKFQGFFLHVLAIIKTSLA